MNIYKVLNEITLYIDENLEEEINYDILSKKMGVNEYTMRRIFSLLTGIPLAEYIRKRRLSNAGYDLYKGDLRVIDIAVKYGYDNATSFSRAFTAFHGIKPSEVNKKSKLKNFPRIIFQEKNDIVEDMEYEIVTRDEITLYGIGTTTENATIEADAPRFFREMEKKYAHLYGDFEYAMITYNNECREECTGYYVLYEKEVPGFEKFIIPKSKWLLFKIPTDKAKDIRRVSQQFYLEFLPSCKYSFRNLAELEYYHDGVCDFLVPIE